MRTLASGPNSGAKKEEKKALLPAVRVEAYDRCSHTTDCPPEEGPLDLYTQGNR